MSKEVRVIFDEQQLSDLEKVKEFYKEKTRKKALVKILEEFIKRKKL